MNNNRIKIYSNRFTWLMCLTGIALSAPIVQAGYNYWTDITYYSQWTDTRCWSLTTVPGTADSAIIHGQNNSGINYSDVLVLDKTSEGDYGAKCHIVYIGQPETTTKPDTARLVIDGGSLLVRYRLSAGGGMDNNQAISGNTPAEIWVINNGLLEGFTYDDYSVNYNGISIGSGDAGDTYYEDAAARLYVNGGIVNCGGRMTIGYDMHGILDIDSGTVIAGTQTDPHYFRMAANSKGSAEANIKDTLLCYGPISIANAHSYSGTYDPDNPRAVMNIDGGFVMGQDLNMNEFHPEGRVNFTGHGMMILQGDDRVHINGYIREGWITAYEGKEELEVAYDSDSDTTQIYIAGHGTQTRNPVPANGSNDLDCVTELQWEAGDNSGEIYDVFLGTSETAVENADKTSAEYIGSTVGVTEKTVTTTTGQTYYWRVDHMDLNNNTIKGKVWNLTLLDYPNNAFAVWTEPSTKRVFMDSRPESFPDPADPDYLDYSLEQARNEYESFQAIVLPKPGVSLDGIKVAFSDFLDYRGDWIESSNFSWHMVGYTQVDPFWRDGKGQYINESARSGFWPDVLLPVDNSTGFDMDDHYAQPIWITAYVPEGKDPGQYYGTVTISSTTPSASITIPLAINVYNFTLPKGPGECKVAFSLHNIDSYSSVDAYYDFIDFLMLEYKLNPSHNYSFSAASGTNPFHSCETLQYFLSEGMNNLTVGTGANIPCLYSYLLDVDEFHDTNIASKAWSMAGGETVPNIVGATTQPDQQDWISAHRNMAKAAWAPNVEMQSTFKLHYFWGDSASSYYDYLGLATGEPEEDMYRYYMDWITPTHVKYRKSYGETLREHGMDQWLYSALEDDARYAGFLVYYPLMESRTLFWQMFNQKVHGYRYYNVMSRRIVLSHANLQEYNPSQPNPFIDGWDYHYQGTNMGAGQLIYMGPNETPIGSVRLANIRDGIEDYNYLKLLEKKYGSFEKADSFCQNVSWSMHEDNGPVAGGATGNFTRDHDTLMNWRGQIANAIANDTVNNVYNEDTGLSYSTINAAITAAGNGDTLVIHPGTYSETISLSSKPLTMRSKDPEDSSIVSSTIIDGGGSSPVITCSYCDRGVTLDGLTIQNGKADIDDTNLMFHLKLDETSGFSAPDSAGSYNGTLTNFSSSDYWTDCVLDGGLVFDGTDDYITTGNFNTTSTFTYSAWIKPNALPDQHQPIFCRGTGNLWRNGMYLYGSRVYCYIYYNASGSPYTSAYGKSINNAITPGVWQHVAMVLENDRPTLYVNGVDVTSQSDTVTGDGSFNSYSQFPLLVGYGDYDSTRERYFGGEMDDLRVYSESLSTDEVKQLALNTSTNIGNGSGINSIASELVVRNCVIKNNIASDNGGGLYADGSTLTIDKCSFENNVASRGGAIMLTNSQGLVFDQVKINDNVAGIGSGIYIDNIADTTRLTNTIVSRNLAISEASIFAQPSSSNTGNVTLEIVGCTIADNIASQDTAGLKTLDQDSNACLQCVYDLDESVISSIFWNNLVAGNISSFDCETAALIEYSLAEQCMDYDGTWDSACVVDSATQTQTNAKWRTDASTEFEFDDAEYNLTSDSWLINAGSPNWGDIENGLGSNTDALHLDERFDVDGDKRVNTRYYQTVPGLGGYLFDIGAQEGIVQECDVQSYIPAPCVTP